MLTTYNTLPELTFSASDLDSNLNVQQLSGQEALVLSLSYSL